MNKRQTKILVHAASWLALLIVPIMSMGHGEGITPRHVLMSAGVTLSFMTVFYPNYLWITPRYYSKGERRYLFWLLNLAVIVGVATVFHLWMDWCNTLYPNPRRHQPDGDMHYIFYLRNIFNLSIVAAVTTALQLASRWQQTEQARREAEVARAEAELKTLRNQINPHFLLNTLNNIYALTAINAERAQEAIQQLSGMLRHLLYDEQATVPMRDEVEFLENYISLMKIRLPQQVDVQSRFSVLNPQQQVAPMLFISLVENAFKHGISPVEPSFIHISITADEQQIVCDISNSNHPKTAADHSGHGIGLQQVQRRLELAYPGRYLWEHGVSHDGTVYHSRIQITNDKTKRL